MFCPQLNRQINHAVIQTRIGKLHLTACGDKITGLNINVDLPPTPPRDNVLILACKALQNYTFDPTLLDKFPEELLQLPGTRAQQLIWLTLKREVTAGQLCTYSSLAELTRKTAPQINAHPRQVGNAMARNPLPLFIPCHRVLPKNCTLGQYSAGEGATTKALLLKLEGHSVIPLYSQPISRASVIPRILR